MIEFDTTRKRVCNFLALSRDNACP